MILFIKRISVIFKVKPLISILPYKVNYDNIIYSPFGRELNSYEGFEKSEKIKLRSLSVFFCSIISASLFTASVYGASGLSIHDVSAQKQQGGYLCWAAVSSMAGQYFYLYLGQYSKQYKSELTVK
ncbi:hypothetical protein R50912_17465 [Paenibacillus sp. FSL R5-0912]|nr:hypothetical protein R50912_17465 [Paenibacillus sp. FSL R5-0912]